MLSIKDFVDEIVVVNNIPYFKIEKVMVRKLELAPNKLPAITAEKLIKILEKDGFTFIRQKAVIGSMRR